MRSNQTQDFTRTRPGLKPSVGATTGTLSPGRSPNSSRADPKAKEGRNSLVRAPSPRCSTSSVRPDPKRLVARKSPHEISTRSTSSPSFHPKPTIVRSSPVRRSSPCGLSRKNRDSPVNRNSQCEAEVQRSTAPSSVQASSSNDVPREAGNCSMDRSKKSLLLEVRALSGEVLLQDTFCLDDPIEVIKRKIQKTYNHPIFRQDLIWQDNVLQPGSLLKDAGPLIHGDTVHLLLKSLPDSSEIEDAQQRSHAALAAIESWSRRGKSRIPALQELSHLARPPLACEAVCLAVLHLLAGVECTVTLNKAGVASDLTWKAVQAMLRSSTFVQSLHELPKIIARGKLKTSSLEQARRQLENVDGDDADSKVRRVQCQSSAAFHLISWALNMIAYAETAFSISEQWYGANIYDLFPSLDL